MLKNTKKESAKIVWFTGLSGAGKTTLSKKLIKLLKKNKKKTLHIDGDIFRLKKKNKNNFSRINIKKNNLRIIEYIKKIHFKYDYILVSVIAPLLVTRKFCRTLFNKKYYEFYIYCKIGTLIKRDTKGLYKKAVNKKIKNLIGYNSKIKYEKSTYKITKINTDKYDILSSLKIVIKSKKRIEKKKDKTCDLIKKLSVQ